MTLLSNENNPGLHLFCFTTSLIGSKNLSLQLDRSDTKLKPSATCSTAFSSTFGTSLVYTMTSHWLMMTLHLILIGHWDFSGFVISTYYLKLHWKAFKWCKYARCARIRRRGANARKSKLAESSFLTLGFLFIYQKSHFWLICDLLLNHIGQTSLGNIFQVNCRVCVCSVINQRLQNEGSKKNCGRGGKAKTATNVFPTSWYLLWPKTE